MKSRITPKEIQVDLPSVHLFETEDEPAVLASAINTIIHGKVHVKYDLLGKLNNQFVGLFYLKRDHESQNLHDEFIQLIEQEEMGLQDIEEDHKEPEMEQKHKFCFECETWMMLHVKGLDHCICGSEWIKGKCEAQI